MSRYVNSLRNEVFRLDNNVQEIQVLLDNAVGPKSKKDVPEVSVDTKNLILQASMGARMAAATPKP